MVDKGGVIVFLVGVWALTACGGERVVPEAASLVSSARLDSSVSSEGPGESSSVEVYFSPFDAVEERILDLLEGATSEVLIAHYNIRREVLLHKLVELARRGVTVRVVVDRKNAYRSWNTGDDYLLANGIELVRMQPPHPYGLMHLKVVVIDGFTVMTGSFNWNTSASLANDETFLVLRGELVASLYRQKVLELLGDIEVAPTGGRITAGLEVHFVPEENVEDLIISELDQARITLDLAMFALTEWDISEALLRAMERGVRVRLVTSSKMADYGWVDEALEEGDGVVVRGVNRLGKYTAMHSKYCIIDGERLITGAANWSLNGTSRSVEDLLLIDDPQVVARHRANFADLLFIYGGLDSHSESRVETPVLFHARVDHTRLGDTALVVGDVPELGSWDPLKGARLRTGKGFFPNWTVAVNLPAGERVEYKWVVLRADGSVEWEPGANRTLRVSSEGRAMVISGEFREPHLNGDPAP